ncbi:hypothetical protein HK101_002301 [Irineochytrium annulatum]|nr:hypothetical protein HK101_002301 [Irineochytrium annulatum]
MRRQSPSYARAAESETAPVVADASPPSTQAPTLVSLSPYLTTDFGLPLSRFETAPAILSHALSSPPATPVSASTPSILPLFSRRKLSDATIRINRGVVVEDASPPATPVTPSSATSVAGPQRTGRHRFFSGFSWFRSAMPRKERGRAPQMQQQPMVGTAPRSPTPPSAAPESLPASRSSRATPEPAGPTTQPKSLPTLLPLPTVVVEPPPPDVVIPANPSTTEIVAAPSAPTVPTPTLPPELWMRCISFHPRDPLTLGHLSRSFNEMVADVGLARDWLFARYGRHLALLHGWRAHRRRMTREVVVSCLRGGAGVPRFIVQQMAGRCKDVKEEAFFDLLVFEYCRRQRLREQDATLLANNFLPVHPAPASAYVLPLPYLAMTSEDRTALFNLDDVERFEQLTNDLTPANLGELRTLVTAHGFVPVDGQVVGMAFRVYQLSCRADEGWIDRLRKAGLSLGPINDAVLTFVLHRVAAEPLTPAPTPTTALSTAPPSPVVNAEDELWARLEPYLSHGFRISRPLLVSILQDASHPLPIPLLRLLRRISPPHVFPDAVQSVLLSQFGPASELSEAVMLNLVNSGVLTEDAVKRALILEGDPPPGVPYRTRCYEQGRPMKVWRWVLSSYGPNNALTRMCFDDLMMWLAELAPRFSHREAADGTWNMAAGGGGASLLGAPTEQGVDNLLPLNPSLNPFAIPSVFLDAGVRLAPRHLQSLVAISQSPFSAPHPACYLYRVRRWSFIPGGVPERERVAWVSGLRALVSEREKKLSKALAKTDALWEWEREKKRKERAALLEKSGRRAPGSVVGLLGGGGGGSMLQPGVTGGPGLPTITVAQTPSGGGGLSINTSGVGPGSAAGYLSPRGTVAAPPSLISMRRSSTSGVERVLAEAGLVGSKPSRFVEEAVELLKALSAAAPSSGMGDGALAFWGLATGNAPSAAPTATATTTTTTTAQGLGAGLTPPKRGRGISMDRSLSARV